MFNLEDFKYVTIETENERWFYNTGCQYPLICPKGTKVKFVQVFSNYYGTWFEVEYNGQIKYILPCLCDGNVMIKHEERKWLDIPSLKVKEIHIFTDRFGKKYKLLNEKGDLELL